MSIPKTFGNKLIPYIAHITTPHLTQGRIQKKLRGAQLSAGQPRSTFATLRCEAKRQRHQGGCGRGIPSRSGGLGGLLQKKFCFGNALRAHLTLPKPILQDETQRRLEWKRHSNSYNHWLFLLLASSYFNHHYIRELSYQQTSAKKKYCLLQCLFNVNFGQRLEISITVPLQH